MEVLIRDSAEIGCVLGAKIIANVIREKPKAVLGLATGRTPLRLYQELVRLHRDEGLDFSQVTTFNLDEYVGLDRDHPDSFHRYMSEHFFGHVNLAPERVHIPDGTAADVEQVCIDYERDIAAAGGMDL